MQRPTIPPTSLALSKLKLTVEMSVTPSIIEALNMTKPNNALKLLLFAKLFTKEAFGGSPSTLNVNVVVLLL